MGYHLGDQDEIWAPQLCRVICCVILTNEWKERKILCWITLQWRSVISRHVELRIFCLTTISGYSKKNRCKIQYAKKPAQHAMNSPCPRHTQQHYCTDIKTIRGRERCICFRRLNFSSLKFTCNYHVSYSRCTEIRHVTVKQ